jgi:hypothetical protein
VRLAYVGTKLFPGSSHQDTGIKLLQVQPESSKWNASKGNPKCRNFYIQAIKIETEFFKKALHNTCFICIKNAFMIL